MRFQLTGWREIVTKTRFLPMLSKRIGQNNFQRRTADLLQLCNWVSLILNQCIKLARRYVNFMSRSGSKKGLLALPLHLNNGRPRTVKGKIQLKMHQPDHLLPVLGTSGLVGA